MLDALVVGATGVAIIPITCVTSLHKAKEELLKHHTLKAVMSMPIELFYPVGVVTCIVVFEAHKPHAQTQKKTWFGYWRNDGFDKVRNLGRVDQGDWEKIRDHWVECYRNNEVHSGVSVTRHVTARDEWCAEAYVETDYSMLTKQDFEKTVKNLALYQYDLSFPIPPNDRFDCDFVNLIDKNLIELGELFHVSYGNKFDLNKMEKMKDGISFVNRSEYNNGVSAYVKPFNCIEPYPKDSLTIALGGSVLATFLQVRPFYTGQNVAVAIPKEPMSRSMLLYYATTIMQNRFRYSTCGREANRTFKSILLPAPSMQLMIAIEKYMESLPYRDQIIK